MIYKIEKIPDNVIEPDFGKNNELCVLLDKSYASNVASQWEEKHFEWYDGVSSPKYDFVFIYGTIPVCSENVKDVIETIPNLNDAQFLPIIIEGERYYIISTQNVERDVLNRRKSKIIFDKNKTIMWVKKYVFYPFTPKSCLFKIDEQVTSFFATQELVDIINKNNFTGIEFKECETKKHSILDIFN